MISPKKLFINAIFRPLFYLLFYSNNSYSFKFVVDYTENNYHLVNLKDFFLDFPLFFNSNQESKWNYIEQNSDDKDQMKKISIGFELKNFSNPIVNSKNENLNDVRIEIENIHKSININEEFQLIGNFEEKENKILINKEELEQKLPKIIIKTEKENLGNNKILNNFHSYNINQTKVVAFKSLNDSLIRCLEYPLFLEEIFNQELNQMIPIVDEIITKMSDILYTYPYQILFGRIGNKTLKFT